MDSLLNYRMLGQLEILETFEYYDQPVLFSCRNAAGHLYLVVAADENDQHDTWLYAGVSERRLSLIRSGAIDLHDAFADPEDGCLIQAIVPYGDQGPPQFESIPAHQIPAEMLPIPGEYLFLKTDTLPVLSDPEKIAKSENREIINLKLNFDGVFRTEAPLNPLSNILGSLQSVFNNIGTVFYKSEQLTKAIRREMQLSLLDVGAGSFDVRLASTQIANLYSDIDFGSTLGNAINELLNLLNAGSDQDELRKLFGHLRLRVANSYAKLLKYLNESVTDTEFTWVSPNATRGGTAGLSKLQMERAIEILKRFQEEEPLTFIETGTLIGASLPNKTFQFRTTEQTYSGAIADDALEIEAIRTATISKEYTAKIQETIEKSETTGEIAKTKYHLLNLSI